MITTHQLPEESFTALATGEGNPAVVQRLREVQLSKHLMLLPPSPRKLRLPTPDPPRSRPSAGLQAAAGRAARRPVYAGVALGPSAHRRLVARFPHPRDEGLPPDFGYLAAAAAAAAVRAGVPFELDVPVNDGRVLLPGLGHFHGIDQDSWARLRSDGERLTVGAFSQVPCAALVPDDGSAEPVPHWQGVTSARAVADGQTWTTLLETTDQYLNRFALPMAAALSAEEVASWQACIQSAWEVLVRHHSSAAGSIAAGVSVIVPLAARSDTDLGSATNPAAIGAIAASLPPDPVMMAEILVHEFQHLKLCALQDMAPLTEPCDERVYAPWRQDPRPVGGLLQGVYAHLGIARFWGAQRQAETEPDAILRAQVMFERCRSMIEPATATLLRTGCLTSLGTRFVTMLHDEGQRLERRRFPERRGDRQGSHP